jgi:drug/metabolite transporter (DMT)-like permease
LIVPLHLLFPLFSSIVFVVGMIYAKNAIARGSSPWTGTFLANFWLALSWGVFALITGRFLPVAVWWQAALVAGSFVLGQVLTYLAYKHGDVSVATPIFGVKVIMVALMVSAWANEEIPGRVWIGAVLATVGVGFVQSGTRVPTASAQHNPQKTILTIVLALGAAICMSLFDVGLQAWVFRQPNPAVLATKFLPTVFVATGLLLLRGVAVGRPPFSSEGAWHDEADRDWNSADGCQCAEHVLVVVSLRRCDSDQHRVCPPRTLGGGPGLGAGSVLWRPGISSLDASHAAATLRRRVVDGFGAGGADGEVSGRST